MAFEEIFAEYEPYYNTDMGESGHGASSYGASSALAIGTASSILQSYLSSQSAIDNIKAQSAAMEANVGTSINNFLTEYNMLEEEGDAISRVLGDKITSRGLTAIKEESRLRAAAAETGTSGGTTDVAIGEAIMNYTLDKAKLIAASRDRLRGVRNRMKMKRINHMSDVTAITSGLKTSNVNPIISGVLGGVSAFSTGLNFMSPTMKEDFYTDLGLI